MAYRTVVGWPCGSCTLTKDSIIRKSVRVNVASSAFYIAAGLLVRVGSRKLRVFMLKVMMMMLDVLALRCPQEVIFFYCQ